MTSEFRERGQLAIFDRAWRCIVGGGISQGDTGGIGVNEWAHNIRP